MNHLKTDLKYPLEYERLFDGIEEANELASILKNKDSYVRNKIDSCTESFEEGDTEDIVKREFIEKKDIGEIVVKKPFVLKGSFQSQGIAVRGPVGFERDVTIGRSTIIGPAYVSEKSKIFDSQLRAGPNGAVYIGRNCNLWDYTVIIRSFIGDACMIHTCNLDDSIIGPNSNFGATRALSRFKKSEKKRRMSGDMTLLGQRIVLANYSYGNKIRILDPTTQDVAQIDAIHFGTISGTGVWLASGTIVYPGTIIGNRARINSTIPLIGYIPPNQTYSLYLSIGKDGNMKKRIQPKGTLVHQIKEFFALP